MIRCNLLTGSLLPTGTISVKWYGSTADGGWQTTPFAVVGLERQLGSAAETAAGTTVEGVIALRPIRIAKQGNTNNATVCAVFSRCTPGYVVQPPFWRMWRTAVLSKD